MSALTLHHLFVPLPKGADRAFAVEDLSLTLEKGETLCVVGESGSGKSVTSHAVMGLLPKLMRPKGEILLNGEELLALSPEAMRQKRGLNVTMIFQEPMTALNPVLTIGTQIEEYMLLHTNFSAQERKEKTLNAMRAVSLPDVERLYASYPHQMSGGQRQRAMIAGALILEPDVLIADEPTTALDVTTQAQILKLMKEMQAKTGCGVLFITHDFGVVRDIADKIIVMQQGKVVESGTRDLLDNPQHDYTKMLLASVPSLTPPAREVLTTPPILEVKNLTHIYAKPSFFAKKEGMKALNNVSFTLKTGETLGIVGESGSGKSTVARAIARLITPQSGEIQFEGHDLAKLSQSQLRPLRREMQMVFQDPFRSLNPRRTVEQNLLEGAMNFGLPYGEAIARAKELLETVKMQEAALPRFPHQFSGGQRQRLAIARALMMRPKLILADEPVSALDVSVQKQVLALFEEIKVKYNLSMVFITHDLRVAAQICNRVAVMSKGEIVEINETQALFAAPQHAYTQALFKAAPGQIQLTEPA